LAEIERLSADRGGFREGVRALCMRMYHAVLRAHLRTESDGTPEAYKGADKEALRRAVGFNRTFRPPLSLNEVSKQVRGRVRGYFRAETIARALHVSVQEAETLDLDAIAPESVRRKHREAEEQARAESRSAREAQRAEIAALISAGQTDAQIAECVGCARMTVYRMRMQSTDRREEGGGRKEGTA
jgi:DNA-binding CsgD family transcriptional regulator